MTVSELEAILAAVKNKEMVVCNNNYCSSEINGYYINKRDNEEALFLTDLFVQPRSI